MDELKCSPKEKLKCLDELRWKLRKLNSSARVDGEFWPALRDAIQRYQIPISYLEEVVDGVEQDLEPTRYTSWSQLYAYCYQVASVVGLAVVHVLGFRDPEALKLAINCGIAFQMTNILRDLREDAARGRIYLPSEDFQRFQVDPEELLQAGGADRIRRLLEYEIQRAQRYYQDSRRLVQLVSPAGRPFLRAIVCVYEALLREIARDPLRVLRERIELPAWRKAVVAGKAAIGLM